MGKAKYKPNASGLGARGGDTVFPANMADRKRGRGTLRPVKVMGENENIPHFRTVELLPLTTRDLNTPVTLCRQPTVADKRDMRPADILTANPTLAEEPLRKLLNPDQEWMGHVLPESTDFPIQVMGDPLMIHLDQWLCRLGISLPVEMAPVIKNRAIQRLPGIRTGLPSDEWAMAAFQDALTYLSKIGPKKDGLKAVLLMNALRANGHLPPRAGNVVATIVIGEATRRIDYSPLPLTVGFLRWIGIDSGDQLSLENRLRTALSEPDKRVRNQCVVLHLASAYDWFPQWCPRRPPSASRVPTAAQQIRKTEYQEASACSKDVNLPDTCWGSELLAAVRDVLNSHHERGFEDLNSFSGAIL